MPFPSLLSAPQLATLRTSGWWTRVLTCLNDNAVVFRAQASQTIDSVPFITFTWDNADIGAFGDVWEGMIVFLSRTTSIRDAYFRGRVRLAPSATEFYIGLNSEVLTNDDFLIVVRDTDLFARIRTDTLVDGSITYKPLAPQLEGLPFAIVLYDALNAGTIDFTPAQTGIAVDANATAVDTWAWDISGDGTSSIDDATLEHPTFTFEAGYHYLLRVIYTDDNGTTNYQISHVYAVTRTFGLPCLQSIVTGSVNGDIEDGWTASLTAYADVSTLIDRTHCVVWHVQHFGDDSDTPMVSNVLMNGRIRSDSIQTEGSRDAGQIQQVSFTVEGITAYLRRLKIPNDIIRASVNPTQWGEIKQPNPYRMACYAAWTYSTLTNIGSFGVETGAFSDWQIGREPRAVDGGFIADVLKSLLFDTIKAAVNYAPTGELYLARTVSYLSDRSGVVTIAAFTLSDILDYNVDRDSSRTIAQVIAFGGVFNTAVNDFVLYTAQSPSIIYGDGSETLELTRDILVVDSTVADAKDELKSRASLHYAYNNPKPALELTLFDSWAGALIPSNFQRWAAVLPASSNTLGIAYSATDYWQLQSVALTINSDGTIDTSANFPAETTFDDAQTIASLLPNNLSAMNPVLPDLPNDPAFPTDPLENYPSDTPGVDDLLPIDPFTGMVAYTPFDPATASQIALAQGGPGEKVLQPNFRNSVNTVSSWTTTLDVPYVYDVNGFTQSSEGVVTKHYDFTKSDYGIWGGSALWPDMNLFRDSSGYHENFNIFSVLGVGLKATFPSAITTALIQVNYVYAGTGIPGQFNFVLVDATALYNVDSATPPPVPFIDTGSNTFTTFTFQIVLNTGAVTVTSATFQTGTGTSKYIDAFYEFELDDEGNAINVVPLSTDGLYLDNTQVTPIPDFAPDHRYSGLSFTGTGNQLNARMELADYTTVQSNFLTITMRRKP